MQRSAWIQQKAWRASPLLEKSVPDRPMPARYWLNISIFHLDLTDPGIVSSELASLDASRTARALYILIHKPRFYHRSRAKASRHYRVPQSFRLCCCPSVWSQASTFLFFPSSCQSVIFRLFDLIRRLPFLLVRLTTRFLFPQTGLIYAMPRIAPITEQ